MSAKKEQQEQQEQTQLKPNGDGIGRLFKAFNCSILGFKAAFKHESAFRQEILLCLVLFPFSFILASSLSHWVGLICSLLLLLLIEVINSAIEALADRISTDRHELLGRAKDLGSAAVFLAMLIVGLVWLSSLYQVVYPDQLF